MNIKKPKISYHHLLWLALITTISVILRLNEINLPPFYYLSDAEYQYYFLTLYHLKQISHTFTSTPINPYPSFEINNALPWNMVLKANAYLWSWMGENAFWLPRIESILAWHVAGIFLFLTCLNFFSFAPSFVALIVFYLSPNAFLLSRCYLPEPIMIMLASISFYTIVLWQQKQETYFYLLASFFSCLTIYFLPKPFFLLIGIYIGFGMSYRGILAPFKEDKTYLYIAFCLIPLILYRINGWGAKSHENHYLLWNLLGETGFWIHWRNSLIIMMETIKDYSGSILFSITAFFLITQHKLRVPVLVMLFSYGIFGLFFTYHIHTHYYYSIQFFLIYFLLIAGSFDFLYRHSKSIYYISALPALMLLSFYWYFSSSNVWRENESKLAYITHQKQLSIFEDINKKFKGMYIISSPSEGMYYHTFNNNIRIEGWPEYANYYGEKRTGMHKNETYQEHLTTLLNKAKQNGARYFVVNDITRYENDPTLVRLLKKYKNYKYTLASNHVEYLVFDLSKQQ